VVWGDMMLSQISWLTHLFHLFSEQAKPVEMTDEEKSAANKKG
jgi:hypothetical protein